MAKKKIYTYDHQVRTLSLKFYDEQMPQGWEIVQQNIRAMDKSKWQAIGICHDRDPVGDDFWEPSVDKKHYHIIVRMLNEKRVRVKQVLDALGIVYRPGVDKNLWENRGVETCNDFCDETTYLPHWTKQAEIDGKARYELDELVSNLSIEEIKQIIQGYTRVSDAVEKVTPAMLAKLSEDAYKLGYELGDFDKWYNTMPFNVFSHSKIKNIRDKYNLGVDNRLEKDEEIPRLCVYIEGAKDVGKSYAARYACRQLGLKYLRINGGGTGRFDQLTVSHDAIIVDDRTVPNLLNMADVQYCRVYRRNKNNPPWVGRYLIVTSNYSFDKWLNKCGIDEENKDAARSRFFICHIEKVKGKNELVCPKEKIATRGNKAVKKEVRKMYTAFRDYYNESLAAYDEIKNEEEDDDFDPNTDAYNDMKREEREETERAEAEKKRAEKEKKKRDKEELEEKLRDPVGYAQKKIAMLEQARKKKAGKIEVENEEEFSLFVLN